MNQPEQANRTLTIAVACLATAMLMLDISVINTALSDIAEGLDTGLSGLQWVIDAYTIPLAATVLTAGAIADRLGRRKLFVLGLVVFTVSSALCGAAPRDRGPGRRAGDPGARRVADVRDRARADLAGDSRPRGPAQGARRLRRRDRRVVRDRAVHRRRADRAVRLAGDLPGQRPDRRSSSCGSPTATSPRAAIRRRGGSTCPGQITLIGGLFLLVLALLRGNEDGWGSAGIVAALVGAAAFLIAFVIVEERSREPMLPLRLMRRRRVRRRAGRGVRDRGVVLRRVPLPDALPADGPRHVADPDRPRLPAGHVPGVRRLGDDGAARGELLAREDRERRAGARRRRAGADAVLRRRLVVDRAAARPARDQRRHRAVQPDRERAGAERPARRSRAASPPAPTTPSVRPASRSGSPRSGRWCRPTRRSAATRRRTSTACTTH